MEDQGEFVRSRRVEMRYLDLEQVGSEGNKWHQVLFLGDGSHVVDDAIQDIVR